MYATVGFSSKHWSLNTCLHRRWHITCNASVVSCVTDKGMRISANRHAFSVLMVVRSWNIAPSVTYLRLLLTRVRVLRKKLYTGSCSRTARLQLIRKAADCTSLHIICGSAAVRNEAHEAELQVFLRNLGAGLTKNIEGSMCIFSRKNNDYVDIILKAMKSIITNSRGTRT